MFCLIAFLSVATIMRWHATEYVGTIHIQDASTFTLRQAHGESYLVHHDQQTFIHKGRARDVPLVEGDMVVVVGTRMGEKEISARMIRILNPPRAAQDDHVAPPLP